MKQPQPLAVGKKRLDKPLILCYSVITPIYYIPNKKGDFSKMNPVVFQKTYEFSEGVSPIVLEAVRLGRGIRVEAGIYLPASVDGGLLWPLDCWDLKIGGQSLQKVWGYPCRLDGKRYRGLWRIFSALTWEAAEQVAIDWLDTVPRPLLDAIKQKYSKLGLDLEW